MDDTTTDEALMQSSQEGDRDALGVLLSRHSRGLHSLLSRLVRDRALADELLQSTFLAVIGANGRFHQGRPVVPWLLTIAGNAARDSLRRSRMRERALRLHVVDRFVEPSTDDPWLRARLTRAFEALPVRQRECVELHKLDGRSFAQIAEQLHITESAARLRAHRGYAQLRELLADVHSSATSAARGLQPEAA